MVSGNQKLFVMSQLTILS